MLEINKYSNSKKQIKRKDKEHNRIFCEELEVLAYLERRQLGSLIPSLDDKVQR